MLEKQSKSPVVHVLLPSKLVAINWFDCAVGWLTTTVTLDADTRRVQREKGNSRIF
jgi:hypothetical protein